MTIDCCVIAASLPMRGRRVAPPAAQAWPDRPIKFIMSAPAGSSIDVLGRTIADKLKDRLGQPVVVENKPAAGGTVATRKSRTPRPTATRWCSASTGRWRSRRCCRSCRTTCRRISRR